MVRCGVLNATSAAACTCAQALQLLAGARKSANVALRLAEPTKWPAECLRLAHILFKWCQRAGAETDPALESCEMGRSEQGAHLKHASVRCPSARPMTYITPTLEGRRTVIGAVGPMPFARKPDEDRRVERRLVNRAQGAMLARVATAISTTAERANSSAPHADSRARSLFGVAGHIASMHASRKPFRAAAHQLATSTLRTSRRLQEQRMQCCAAAAASFDEYISSARQKLEKDNRRGALRDWERALKEQNCTDAQKRVLLFNCASIYATNGDAELAQVRVPGLCALSCLHHVLRESAC